MAEGSCREIQDLRLLFVKLMSQKSCNLGIKVPSTAKGRIKYYIMCYISLNMIKKLFILGPSRMF